MSFISPFEIEDGCNIISEHTLGKGMEFNHQEDTDNDEGRIVTLAKIR